MNPSTRPRLREALAQGERYVLTILLLVAGACGGGDDGVDNDAGVDAPACTLPAGGVCQGNMLVHCDGDQMVTEDCTTSMSTCGVGDGGAAACVDECTVAGVTETAICRDDATVKCATINGRHAVITTGCGFDGVCSTASGTAACEPDPCLGIGPIGECNGDTLVQCTGGARATTDCTTGGQVCGYTGDANGYACIAPTAQLVVSGTIRYEDRPPQNGGGLGPTTPAPVRSAEVAVVLDSDMSVLATGSTGDDGTYVLRYTATPGAMVHVMATSRSTVASRPVRVYRTGSTLHAFGGPSFAAATSLTQDVLITETSTGAHAFNVLDQGVRAMDAIKAMGGTPQQLTARWASGSTNGTYYSNGTIYLLGSSSDDDGYDDTVILHEIGHFVEDRYARSDSPGGNHDGSPTDPTLAWSEGFATYWAMSVRGIPVYVDTNAGGGWADNADTSATSLTAGATMSSDISESTVTEVLWDIGDGGMGDDDLMSSATHADVLGVSFMYLRTATLRAVGVSGVDLVDFLDGWFVREGRASCAGVRYPVTTRRMFPYDYAGPAGACP